MILGSRERQQGQRSEIGSSVVSSLTGPAAEYYIPAHSSQVRTRIFKTIRHRKEKDERVYRRRNLALVAKESGLSYSLQP